jgi:hypothetical protein
MNTSGCFAALKGNNLFLMNSNTISYNLPEWKHFTDTIKYRDQFTCLHCGRKEPEIILQVHHKSYKSGVKIWEYPTSDCISLCKGCHAREHALIEPNCGWTLVLIEDYGDLDGICEANNCGQEIRFGHVIYHPTFGYKTVGSTCVDFLTSEEKLFSKQVLKELKGISSFLRKSKWEKRNTKNGNEYLFTTYHHHQIRIYGKENFYSFQIVLKCIGSRWYDYRAIIKAKNKELVRVKELAYIVLKGMITEEKQGKEILRNIYKSIL